VRFVAVDENIALDMLFTGQTHTLQVNVQRSQLSAEGLRQAFTEAYQSAFGRVLEGPVIRVMNLRYARIGRRPKFDLSVLAPVGAGSTQPLGVQRVYHQGQWWDAQRYARLELPNGAKVIGPAILEQADTTVWLEPGFEAKRAAVTANRRVGEPQDIADVAVFLASPRSAYVNAAELAVDGGMTSMMMDMVPRPGFNQTAASPQAVAHA
jgi:N-methylhydantoinase A/oxoprolinase/acetone carboxylase beta subunit